MIALAKRSVAGVNSQMKVLNLTQNAADLRKIVHSVKQSTNRDTCVGKKIKVITKLPNSEQSYKGKVKTHYYINRQNQSTTGKL